MPSTSDLSTPSRLRSSASVPSFHSPTKGPHLPTSSSTPLSSITQHVSDAPRRPATPSEYLSSPIKHTANAHPYAIHSSSTSILTRTISSPAKTIEPGRYRPSMSMSSMTYILGDSKSPSGDEKKKAGQGEDVAVPLRRMGLKKSSSIASFTFDKEEKVPKPEVRPDLPANSKSWTPSDLAAYLAWTLRTGGTDGSGDTLPDRLVDDINSWVFRHRISGREFLKVNSEVWSTSRPPPFFSLLLTLSRKLRRQSIQGKSFHRGEPSVFQEDEEEEDLSQTEEPLRGVKSLARTYETIANSDTAGHGGEFKPLEPQWTGSSTSSAVWERWGIKRQQTGMSTRSVSSTCQSEDPTEEGPASRRADPETGTLAVAGGSDSGPAILGKGSPPPYTSPISPLDDTSGAPSIDAALVISPEAAGAASPPRVLSAEPEPPLRGDYVPGFGQRSDEDHIRDQLKNYKTLRASDHLPLGLGFPSGDNQDEDDEGGDATGTARRVTLRPLSSNRSTSVRGIFSSSEDSHPATDFGPSWNARDQEGLDQKLDEICRRLSYLEEKIQSERSHRQSLWSSWRDWTPESLRVAGIDELVQGFGDGDPVTMSSLAGLLLFTGIGLGMLAGGVMSRRR